MNTILGTKKEMTQTFVDGARVPVTVVKVPTNIVTHIRNEKDGHWGIQMGMGSKKMKNITKPVKGHLAGALKKTKVAPLFLREFSVSEEPKEKVGDQIKVASVLSEGDVVTVTSTSKGKGFAGTIKRWGFAAGPRTHGQSDRRRAPGSIGQGTTPGRVWKGKKMSGRMGSDQVTLKNVKVLSIDEKNNEVSLSGPIAGTRGSLVIIKK